MRRLAALFALLCLTLAAAVPVQAAPFDFFKDVCQKAADSTACKDNVDQSSDDNSITGPNGVISKATNILTFIIGAAALIVIIISGLQFVLATGDPARIANARNALIYALIGMGIAVFAQVIVKFVVNKL
jgi:hypothetical protein